MRGRDLAEARAKQPRRRAELRAAIGVATVAAVLMPLTRQLRPIGPYKLLGKVVEGFKRGSKEVRLRCRPISLLQQLTCAPLVFSWAGRQLTWTRRRSRTPWIRRRRACMLGGRRLKIAKEERCHPLLESLTKLCSRSGGTQPSTTRSAPSRRTCATSSSATFTVPTCASSCAATCDRRPAMDAHARLSHMPVARLSF